MPNSSARFVVPFKDAGREAWKPARPDLRFTS
jgi:hypothetical protein